MIWLIWRQHRAMLLAVIAILGLISIFYITSGFERYTVYNDSGLGACLDQQRIQCAGAYNNWMSFSTLYDNSLASFVSRNAYSFLVTIPLLPVLIGIFLGAPLVAREKEQRTHYLAWAQGITRNRWLARKLFWLVPLVVLSVGCFNILTAWYVMPDAQFNQSSYIGMAWSYFATYGPLLTLNTLFALLLGIAVGTVLPRVIPAMAVTLLLFMLVQVGLSIVRPNYLPQQVAVSPINDIERNMFVTTPAGSWVTYYGYKDRQGNRLGQNLMQICGKYESSSLTKAEEYEQCRSEQGLNWITVYIPKTNYWSYQMIESGILLALSALLVPLTFWWLKRRMS